MLERYPDFSYYLGEKKNGLRHGKGKFYYANSSMYDGEWKNGYIHGRGTLYSKN